MLQDFPKNRVELSVREEAARREHFLSHLAIDKPLNKRIKDCA